MTAYIDTGILVKLYTPEANTPEAVRLVSQFKPPFAFTHWQELELRTALRLKVFRREMTEDELRRVMRRIGNDLVDGHWQRPRYDLAAVYHTAERLSAQHAATVGCRTLDILHVAAALVIGARDFLTFDTRQGELARRAGMQVRP